MAAINSFHSIRCADLNLLNSANIVLLEKKEGAECISKF